MSTLSIFKVFILFNILTYFTVCNRDPLLAFNGCNASLQWNIGNSSYREERIYFRITGNAGDVIATEENSQCTSKNNIYMSCILSHTNENWIVVLTLMNITRNHTGNYTAWLRDEQLLHFVKKTTPLIVIDQPRIKEIWKPVLYQSFSVECTTSYKSDCITYYWKINDSDLQETKDLQATMSTLTFRNITMMDHFSTLTCQTSLEKCSNVQCTLSEKSDPYTVEPYYGPMYVSLTHNESIVYLEENATYKVKCSASCYPACTFRWEGHYINVEDDELVINKFNERLSGAYTCTARNPVTGVSAKSYPLFLHYEKENSSKYLLGAGLVIVAVCLVIVGALIFVTYRRKYESRRLISLTVKQPCEGPTNLEITQDFLRFEKQDIPLPTPAVSDSSYRIPRRSWYPNKNRQSLSLHSLFNPDQAFWRPVRQSVSLQSLIKSSHGIGRRVNSDDSLCKPFSSMKGRRFSIDISETGIRPKELNLNVKQNKQVGYKEQNPDSIYPSMISVRSQSSAHEQQELYSTIDESIWSEYDYVRANMQVQNIQENKRNTDAGNYEYDYAILPPL
ncbi:hypothetical protein ACJMK2_026031 [Sinanodonta woodiana]|uniref:Ig-like domain-containing protein n=1 Tax=Sinanodonta woodiana TaxID=1069815 RepID=A0ABD3XJV4_SINWO